MPQDLGELLEGKTIVAIPDVHTSPTSRRAAHKLIAANKAKVFFMEYKRSAKTKNKEMQDRYGTYLNDAIAAMRRDRTVNAFDMLQSYFV